MFSQIKRSLATLNSMLLVVGLAYVLEPAVLGAFFRQEVRESFFGWLILAVLSGLRVCYYSGIYGAIIEVLSGEHAVLSRQRFISNFKEYWKTYLGLLVPVFAVHAALFFIMPRLEISFSSIMAGADAMVLLALSRIMIRRKYQRPLKTSGRTAIFDLNLVGMVLALTVMNVLFLPLLGLDKLEFFFLHRVLVFIARYAHFFAFILIAGEGLAPRRCPGLADRFRADKELILINPLGGAVLSAITSMVMRFYPALFVVLRSLTPKDYQITEFNQVIWRDRFFKPGKLVAITCYSSNAPEAYRIAKEFKRRGSRVVMGGSHVSFFPEEALDHCDSVVVGDAEIVWPQIVADYEQGKLQRIYDGEKAENYFQSVYDTVLPGPPELAARYLETSRGCKYNCDFCTIPVYCGKPRQVPLDQIVALVRKASQTTKKVMFFDNNIYADPAYARELFKALIPLKIQWLSCSSIDLARNDEDLQLAKQSGCTSLLVGYEIAGPADGRPVTGKFAFAADYRDLSMKFQKAGIAIKAHFILGFDHDDYRTYFEIWKFCFSVIPSGSALSLLVPFPGTRVFDRMLAEDRLLSLNWRNYACHRVVFQPARMNPMVLNWLYAPFYGVLFLTTCRLGFIFVGVGILLFIWTK